MKKKRGFTLVELLAVLVIIAVILLLIAPQILKKINDSKSSLYDTQMEEIKKAARVYMSNLNIDNTITISLGELKKAGLVIAICLVTAIVFGYIFCGIIGF